MTTIRQRIVTVLALLTVAAAAAACSTPAEDHGEHDHGTGIPSGASTPALPPLPGTWGTLDRTSADAIATAALAGVFDWHPENGDIGPESAAKRARPLFAARAADEYKPYPIPRVTWQDWMDNGATVTTTSTITNETHPADTDFSWQRKTATQITVHTVGKPDTAITVISLIKLQKQPVWTVTSLVHLP